MTLSNVTVGKELRVSHMNAPCDEDDRWHLELVRFEPVVSFPFSYYYSLIITPGLQKKFCKGTQPHVYCV